MPNIKILERKSNNFRQIISNFVLLSFISFFTIFFFSSNVNCADPSKEAELKAMFDQGWALLGTMHKNKAVLDDIIKIYQKAITIDPTSEVAYWKLAEVTFKKADEITEKVYKQELLNKVTDYSKKGIEINPNCLEAHYWLGCAHVRSAEIAGIFSAVGLVKEAKKELELSIKLDPDNRFAILARAVLSAIYCESPWPLKDMKKAHELASEAVKRDPNLTLACERLALVYIEEKKYDEARQELNRGLAIKKPTYEWDSILYDWPKLKKILKSIEGKN